MDDVNLRESVCILTLYSQVCLMSTESAAVYFDGRRVVENPGYIQQTCERVDLSVGEHDVKLRSFAFWSCMYLCMSCVCGLWQHHIFPPVM
jgi:hypothetical protein